MTANRGNLQIRRSLSARPRNRFVFSWGRVSIHKNARPPPDGRERLVRSIVSGHAGAIPNLCKLASACRHGGALSEDAGNSSARFLGLDQP